MHTFRIVCSLDEMTLYCLGFVLLNFFSKLSFNLIVSFGGQPKGNVCVCVFIFVYILMWMLTHTPAHGD